jgi:DNA-binding transcriptional LysR family regulator
MFVSCSSLAYWMVTALRKVFDAEYAAEIGPVSAPGVVCRVREPTLLDMFTIRGDAERRSSGSIALVTRITPITLVSTATRTVAGLTVVGVCGTPPITPALLTKTSRRPACSSIDLAAASTLVSSVTSSDTPNASAPAARSFATAASRCSSRAPTPTRQETRELRYFVAVAEELHFGRAAQRLGIAQPPLSRAVRQLERRLGAALLDRTSRAVTLTEAGSVLLREGREALDAVAAAERRARRAALAATGHPGVVLVMKAGASSELLAKLLDAYAAEPDAATVDVLLCGPGEQERLLRDGRADVALLHRPFDVTAGFDTEELRTEGQVVVLPAGHPLTDRAHTRMAEVTVLPGLPLPRWPRPDGTYPDGPGPRVRDHAQLFQLIALGRASAVLPESCRTQLRDGLATVPVLDAPTVTTVIAWPPHSRSRAVAGLVQTATRL